METRNIREESKNYIPSIYLTIVGVIQSIAMSFLVASVANEGLWQSLSSLEIATQWLKVLIVGGTIVFIWHINIQHTVIFKRSFGLTDSFVPFAFIVPEYLLIESIPHDLTQNWFFAVSLVTALSWFGYWDLYRACTLEKENDFVFDILGSYTVKIQIYIVSVSLITLSFALINSANQWVNIALILLTSMLFNGFMYMHDSMCWRKVAPLSSGDEGDS